jgi:hypothetical protein
MEMKLTKAYYHLRVSCIINTASLLRVYIVVSTVDILQKLLKYIYIYI